MENSKQALRIYFSEKLLTLSSEKYDEQSLALANQCLKLPIWELEYFHLFLPIVSKAEVDTSLILTLLQGRDKQVVLPKVVDGDSLDHILLTILLRAEPQSFLL